MRFLLFCIVGLLFVAAPAAADWRAPGAATAENATAINPGRTLLWNLSDATGLTDAVNISVCGSWRLGFVPDGGTLDADIKQCAEDDGGTLVCGPLDDTYTGTIAGKTSFSGSSPLYKVRVDIVTCAGGCDGFIILTCGDRAE